MEKALEKIDRKINLLEEVEFEGYEELTRLAQLCILKDLKIDLLREMAV